MHIIAHRTQVTVAAAIDEQRFVAAAEHVTKMFVPAVEPHRVGAQQPLHADDQVGFGCLDDEMKMIAHEAPGMDLPVGAQAGFFEGLEEVEAVEIGLEDGFAAVAAVHEVVDGSLVLDAQLPGHGWLLAEEARRVNCRVQKVRTDPFSFRDDDRFEAKVTGAEHAMRRDYGQGTWDVTNKESAFAAEL